MTNDPIRQADIERRLANLAKAPRCGARTRLGSPCRQAAVKGRTRCRMHGGAKGSGGPPGSRNGNFKRGFWTTESKRERSKALPPPWRPKPRSTPRPQERKFQDGRLDLRGNQRAQMAAVSRAVVCQERDNRMTDKTNNSLTPVATQPGRLPVNQPGPSPVRVKLRRVK